MKLLIFGHSYVRDLSRLNLFSFKIGEEQLVNIKYIYFPGAGYEKILKFPHILLDPISEYKPDIILVILAIATHLPSKSVYAQCEEFYKLLRANCTNSFKIIAAQAELRFFETNCHRICKGITSDIYRSKRNKFNKFLNKLSQKDFLLMVGGVGRLDHKVYYRDGTHLTRIGLTKYITYIKCTVAFAVRHSKAN